MEIGKKDACEKIRFDIYTEKRNNERKIRRKIRRCCGVVVMDMFINIRPISEVLFKLTLC